MEKAAQITTVKNLDLVSKDYKRIYFGSEFCEELIPSINELKKVFAYAEEFNKKITIVTPYATDWGVSKLKEIFEFLSSQKNPAEVVINDYGVLEIAKEFPKIIMIAGRLLVKQKSGPEIKDFIDKLNDETVTHLKSPAGDSDAMLQFYAENKIKRIEIDNPSQGVDLSLPQEIKSSIHSPYVYTTTTRLCRLRQGEQGNCARNCLNCMFEIKNANTSIPLKLKGNTIFYKQNNLPHQMEKMNIDRIITDVEIKEFNSGKRLLLRLDTQCNNKCIHCTILDIKQFPGRTFEEIKNILEESYKEGCTELVLMRGEPTIRKDFFEIVQYAKELGYSHIQVQTNGRMLSYLPFLKKCITSGIKTFEISIYAHYSEMHDYISSVKGSFNQTIQGIKNLIQTNQDFILTVPVLKTNLQYLHEIVHLANELGVKKIQFNITRPLEETKKELVYPEESVPYLIKAIEEGKQKAIEVSVEAMPFCFMDDYKNHIISENMGNTKIVDLHRSEESVKKLKKESRINFKDCDCCSHNKTCPRTWASYEKKLPLGIKKDYDVCFIHPPNILQKEFYYKEADLIALNPEIRKLKSEYSTHSSLSFSYEPMGLESMKRHIEKNSDYNCKKINLAHYGNLFEKSYKLIKEIIKKNKVLIYGIDFHWLPQCQGAIKLAKIIKEVHPDSYIVLGGLSASFFRKEIIDCFPFIDFVIRGDGEKPLLELLNAVKKGKDFSNIPNLAFRQNGVYRESKGIYVSAIDHDYSDSFFALVKKGCRFNCAHCGSSRDANNRVLGYSPKTFSVKKILETLSQLKKGQRIHFANDIITELGDKWKDLTAEIKKEGIDIKAGFDFNIPLKKEDITLISSVFSEPIVSLWVYTGDEQVRASQGRNYSNSTLMESVNNIMGNDELKLDIFYRLGMIKETKDSLKTSIAQIKKIYGMDKNKKSKIDFYELFYLHPGSNGFMKKSNYNVHFNNLNSFIKNFQLPFFSQHLHFSPEKIKIKEYAELIKTKNLMMNDIYLKQNLYGEETHSRIIDYVDIIKKYEKLLENKGESYIKQVGKDMIEEFNNDGKQ